MPARGLSQQLPAFSTAITNDLPGVIARRLEDSGGPSPSTAVSACTGPAIPSTLILPSSAGLSATRSATRLVDRRGRTCPGDVCSTWPANAVLPLVALPVEGERRGVKSGVLGVVLLCSGPASRGGPLCQVPRPPCDVQPVPSGWISQRGQADRPGSWAILPSAGCGGSWPPLFEPPRPVAGQPCTLPRW